MRPIPLFLFAKAPIAGKVKTRLQSHCSAEQAAGIAEILLEESIKRATQSWPGEVFLSVWLDDQHPFIQRMLSRYSINLVQQCGGDLGEKMQHTFMRAHYPAAIMGCDAPHIAGATLIAAYDALLGGESVIAPSIDGGYYLIGLAQEAAELFAGPAWGSDTVLETTLYNATQIDLELTQLAALNDVDEWPDLLDAADHIRNLKDYLISNKLT